jgi:redox-sensitive bicupin YhaK (pirin superfamily)
VVEAIRTTEGEGFSVRRPFPTRALDHLDPFLLLDEMGPMDVAPGQAKGAPDHPHRGFETVTYLLAGAFEHRDSQGHAGRLAPGDVQWMTAGAGVIHSEMPARDFQSTGGRLHGFQLWVNLPARDKMMQPRYQEVPAGGIPVAEGAGGLATARVIAGEAFGARAAIDTRTPISYLHFTLRPGAEVLQPVPPEHNAFAYVFAGEARFGPGDRVGADGEMVMFGEDGDGVRIAAGDGPVELLLLAGEPLAEPVARYGPFVMNTREQLVQAFEDYQSGRFGRIG